jgi:hypothetical protein
VRAYIESSFHHINDRALVEMTLASISVLLIVLLVSSADIGASPAQQSQQTGDQASIKPDLTTLAKRNKGKFPAYYVTRVLVNGPKPAHGTAEMPVWGPLFSELNAKGRLTVEIQRVVHYLESLQEK